MKQHDLDKYLNNMDIVEGKINEFIKQKIIRIEKPNKEEVQGHLLKSEHNLKFVKDNIKLNYLDWAITGCYYASYHSASPCSI